MDRAVEMDPGNFEWACTETFCHEINAFHSIPKTKRVKKKPWICDTNICEIPFPLS